MKLMNKTLIRVLIIAATMSLTACGFYTVEPASKGKILTTSGYQPEVLEPGKYTLWFRDDMVILDTSSKVYNEGNIEIKLKDKLTLFVDVKFSGRISSDPSVVNTIFNDIVAGKDRRVDFDEVYSVYGRMIIRNITREIISQYSVDDVHTNYKRISQQIAKAVLESFKTTPIELSQVMIGNINYPSVINASIEANEERRLAIEKEEAQAAIDMTKKENELLLANKNYEIEITRAKAIRDSNKIIGEGITDDLLSLRALEVQETMSANKNVVFMPYEAMGTIGAQQRIYSK
jgi:uncharacterized protein YejL (UPF0352 family)